MRCRECSACVQGYYKCAPNKYVCVGVPEPFVIKDIDVQCTEYPEKRDCQKMLLGDEKCGIGVLNNKIVFIKDAKVIELTKENTPDCICEYCSSNYNQTIQCYHVRFHSSDESSMRLIKTKFCPNCGRKLEE